MRERAGTHSSCEQARTAARAALRARTHSSGPDRDGAALARSEPRAGQRTLNLHRQLWLRGRTLCCAPVSQRRQHDGQESRERSHSPVPDAQKTNLLTFNESFNHKLFSDGASSPSPPCLRPREAQSKDGRGPQNGQ